MSEITPFDFQGNSVRVITIDGEPWWVAADVCAAVGIVDARDAVSRLHSDDRVQTPVVDSAGRRNPTTWVINESGLYELIIRSDKPEARSFRRWVTAEVLPQIRKTGSYSVKPMTPGELLVQQAQMMLDQERRTTVLEAKVAAIEGAHDEFTTLAYAKLNDLPTDRVSCQKHGQRASRLMRSSGQEPRKRQDATFGTVNVYPVTVLEETIEA